MIDRVLVPLDGSHIAEQSLGYAAAVGDSFDAEIVILRICECRDAGDSDLSQGIHFRLMRFEASAYLKGLQERLSRDGLNVEVEVREGEAAEQILQCAREREIDLVVLGTHGADGRLGFPLGSTIQHVISAARTSLLVVPTGGATERSRRPLLANTLVPLDGSQRAEWALCLAGSLAAASHSTLHMLHVVPVPEMARRFPLSPHEENLRQWLVERNRAAARTYLDSMEAHFRGADIEVRTHLLVSPSVDATIQQVIQEQNIDLLVGCAHGHSGHGEWLYGGTAGSLIAHSQIPFLVFQDLAHEATDHEAIPTSASERTLGRAR